MCNRIFAAAVDATAEEGNAFALQWSVLNTDTGGAVRTSHAACPSP
jgi:hypothetical protein